MIWQRTKNYYHLVQSVFADVWYDKPSQKLTVIGITGTDGKTTTTNLVYHILKHAGEKVAMVSTIGAAIDDQTLDTGFHTTTPSPIALKRYIKKAVDSGHTYLILEVTSHALDQYRAHNIHFAVSAVTNITREHLDYHKSYEEYLKAKARLFLMSKKAILNKDDMSYLPLTAYLKTKQYKGTLSTYGMHSDADLNPTNFPFETKLIGEFNKYNSLAAIGLALSLGIDKKIIKAAVASFGSPIGRQEFVFNAGFAVMIDFAHTPNSIAQILTSIRENKKFKRIIHVFGAAGQRDAGKRPEMGKYSSELADISIITSEDPRGESIEEISNQIASGMTNSNIEILNSKQIQNSNFLDPATQGKFQIDKKYCLLIPDRQEAINKAISLAKKGDIVVITGKGHEQSMNMGHGEEPWSEHEAVKKALKLLNSKH